MLICGQECFDLQNYGRRGEWRAREAQSNSRSFWLSDVRVERSSISCTMSWPALAHTSGSNSNFAWAPSRNLLHEPRWKELRGPFFPRYQLDGQENRHTDFLQFIGHLSCGRRESHERKHVPLYLIRRDCDQERFGSAVARVSSSILYSFDIDVWEIWRTQLSPSFLTVCLSASQASNPPIKPITK
jgi:hypothetical protein